MQTKMLNKVSYSYNPMQLVEFKPKRVEAQRRIRRVKCIWHQYFSTQFLCANFLKQLKILLPLVTVEFQH